MSGTQVSLPLFIALRYLKSSRRDAYITFLSLSAAGGICLGVAALILALAALSGFQTALRQETLARTPHLEIEVTGPESGEDIMNRVGRVKGVTDTQLLTRGHIWVVADGRARPVQVTGFGDTLPREFPDATDRQPGLYVSDRLANVWGLAVGEPVELASSRPTLTPFGPQPTVRRLLLAGTFSSGRSEQTERVAIPLTEARLLLGNSDLRVLIRSTDLDGALVVAEQLQVIFPKETVIRTWRDLNRPLFFALRLEKTLMFIAVFLIVIVAAMALVSDLMLILASKQAEVGMLGAMGATPNALRRVFVFLGSFLVAIGASIGLVIGIGGAWLLDRFKLLSLPDQVYFLDHVPFLVRPLDVGIVLVVTLGLTTLCALMAANRAANLSVVEALRR